jgi:putative SOS response-associated peptidase YedK
MCGRYRLSRRKQILAEHFDAVPFEDDWEPRNNIAPAQPVPAIGYPGWNPIPIASLRARGSSKVVRQATCVIDSRPY